MQANELKGLNAEPELSGVAARISDGRRVNVAPKCGRQRAEEEESHSPAERGRSARLTRDCSLPSLDDGVFRGVVWNVIWGGAAGLHEELGVVDRCCGLDLHVDPAPYVILQRVWPRILHDLKLTVGVELEAVGEGAEAFLHHCDVVSVDIEGQGHVLAFGVLAEELDFQQVLPGDHVSQIVYCSDFIKKVQVVHILLKRKQIQNQSPQWWKRHQHQNHPHPPPKPHRRSTPPHPDLSAAGI